MQRLKWKYSSTVLLFSFLDSIGWTLNTSILPPLLPLIIREFRLNYFEAGLVGMCSTLAYCSLQYPIGYLADRFGRRNIIVFGQLWSALVCFLFLEVVDFWQLLILLTLMGMGNGMHFIPSAALLSDYYAPSGRGRALSIYFSAQGISLIVAPIFAVPLGETYTWKTPFAVVAILEVVVALLYYVIVKEPQREQSIEKAARTNPINRRNMKIGVISHLTGYIFAITNFVPTFLSGKLGLGLYEAGLVYSASSMALVASSWSTFSSFIISRFKAKRAIILSEVLAFATTLAMAPAADISTMVLVLVLQGLMRSIMVPAILSYATMVTHPETRAAEMGFINTLWVLGGVVGPSIIGFLADAVGFELAFATVSVTPLTSVVLTMTLHQDEPS